MMFEPYGNDWTREKLNDLTSFMLCLDDPNAVELDGQYANGDGSFLSITWKDCWDTESRKSSNSNEKNDRRLQEKNRPSNEKCKSEDEKEKFKKEAMLY